MARGKKLMSREGKRLASKNARSNNPDLDALWARHSAEWRDTAQVASFWKDAQDTDPALLKYKVKGEFFELLSRLKVSLIVSREYEHLLLCLAGKNGKPEISYLPLPHPSGVAVDRKSQRVFVASTRNPNQLLEMRPLSGFLPRQDVVLPFPDENSLLVTRSLYLPGCVYLHDLALIDGRLHGNAVGHNAVVSIDFEEGFKRVWWPKCIENHKKPVFEQNHIQLNSIAAGKSLADSFFSASSSAVAKLRPGDANYPVDGRGVIFSGKTREPICTGLTRPHSARQDKGRLFVDNSGYGQLCVVEKGKAVPVVQLAGWTRGLCIADDIAFVGTSRVIPRFKQYAPGLDVHKSVCAVHAVCLKTGESLGSIAWASGNQIFAVECMPVSMSSALPFALKRNGEKEKLIFYAFETDAHAKGKSTKPHKSTTAANSGRSSKSLR
jgi:uncharacterized protein (TIGR03032 family)